MDSDHLGAGTRLNPEFEGPTELDLDDGFLSEGTIVSDLEERAGLAFWDRQDFAKRPPKYLFLSQSDWID